MRRRFTGRHMLAIMSGFFGVVIAVNFAMATLAAETFGGTVVDNSYVASQQFNHWLNAARAQERLGWEAQARLDGSRRMVVEARDHEAALSGATVEAIAHHPLGRSPDVTLSFRQASDGRYVSSTPLPPGRWVIELAIQRGSSEMRLLRNLS